MAQGKKKKGVYEEGCFDFCMGKGVDCVIWGGAESLYDAGRAWVHGVVFFGGSF